MHMQSKKNVWELNEIVHLHSLSNARKGKSSETKIGTMEM